MLDLLYTLYIKIMEITPNIHIDDSELIFTFTHADGPGGQNVNKVATAVQLRFDLTRSQSLPVEVKQRLVRLAGKRLTMNGILVIQAKRYRSQVKNREDALRKFKLLVRIAQNKPKPRKRLGPTKSSREARLMAKKHRSKIKRLRMYPHIDID